jgi:hypothetical protein
VASCAADAFFPSELFEQMLQPVQQAISTTGLSPLAIPRLHAQTRNKSWVRHVIDVACINAPKRPISRARAEKRALFSGRQVECCGELVF